MKKIFVRHFDPLFSFRDLSAPQSQVEKFLALESHPRQKERTTSILSYLSTTTSLMF